ncbi:hypothetical protein LCGC14_1872180 [marine sediment metagenome]|uniref:Uncharacterized protein n=1 Tax=marine sediment metagenome TaxID=412755 RepID=A0A0F9GSS4_9ZZZZ
MPKSAEFFLRLLQRRTAFQSLPQDHVYKLLVSASDGTVDMNIDASGGAVNFDYIVPAGTVYDIFMFSRLNFVIVDGNIRWGRFAGLGAALNNGVLLQVLDDNDVIQQHFSTDVHPLRTNEDFGGLTGVDNVIRLAAGDDAIPIRFSIFKSGNTMTLFPNWRVRVVIQDNLSEISHMDGLVQGILKRTREAKIS